MVAGTGRQVVTGGGRHWTTGGCRYLFTLELLLLFSGYPLLFLLLLLLGFQLSFLRRLFLRPFLRLLSLRLLFLPALLVFYRLLETLLENRHKNIEDGQSK